MRLVNGVAGWFEWVMSISTFPIPATDRGRWTKSHQTETAEYISSLEFRPDNGDSQQPRWRRPRRRRQHELSPLSNVNSVTFSWLFFHCTAAAIPICAQETAESILLPLRECNSAEWINAGSNLGCVFWSKGEKVQFLGTNLRKNRWWINHF